MGQAPKELRTQGYHVTNKAIKDGLLLSPVA